MIAKSPLDSRTFEEPKLSVGELKEIEWFLPFTFGFLCEPSVFSILNPCSPIAVLLFHPSKQPSCNYFLKQLLVARQERTLALGRTRETKGKEQRNLSRSARTWFLTH